MSTNPDGFSDIIDHDDDECVRRDEVAVSRVALARFVRMKNMGSSKLVHDDGNGPSSVVGAKITVAFEPRIPVTYQSTTGIGSSARTSEMRGRADRAAITYTGIHVLVVLGESGSNRRETWVPIMKITHVEQAI